MLVKNCAGAEIIPFPGACRGGCSLGWRWSDTLLIAARVALFWRLFNSSGRGRMTSSSGEFGENLCGKVNAAV